MRRSPKRKPRQALSHRVFTQHSSQVQKTRVSFASTSGRDRKAVCGTGGAPRTIQSGSQLSLIKPFRNSSLRAWNGFMVAF
jgi:hypothetical protein